jgi:transposase InsO family protein
MISSISLRFCFLIGHEKFHHSSLIFNHVERQFGKNIKPFRSHKCSEYISNDLKDFFLTSGVIYKLIPPYAPESNGIAECVNQTLDPLARSMIIAAHEFPSLVAEAVNMGAYLNNRFPHNHFLSSPRPFVYFLGNNQQYHTLSSSEATVIYISQRTSIPREVNILHVLASL